MRHGLSLALAAAGLACAASSAEATTICVNAPAGCAGIAVTSANLQIDALTGGAAPAGSFDDGVPDTIQLAPGTYTTTGSFRLNAPGSDHVTIRGAGMSATTLTSSGASSTYVLDLGTQHPRTVSDLRVRVPASFPDLAGGGINAGYEPSSLQRVRVVSDNIGSTGIRAGNTFVGQALYVEAQGGAALDAGSYTKLSESQFDGAQAVLADFSATAMVETSLLRATVTAGMPAWGLTVRNGSEATVRNSVVELRGDGVTPVGGVAVDGAGAASTSTATLDHVDLVIPVGLPSGATQGLSVQATFAGGAAVTMSDSIMHDPVVAATRAGSGANAADLTVSHSDVPVLPAGTGAGATTQTANLNVAPGFVDPSGGDYRLAEGSPLVDAGTPGYALSNWDLSGADRVTDGNGDGVARTDIGVYERLGVPLVSGGGGGGGGSTSGASGPAAAPAQEASASAPQASPSVARTCRVPRLRRRTPAGARKALVRAHCRLGRVTKPKKRVAARSLRVKRQSRKGGRVVPAGTRVAIRVAPRR